MSMHCVVVLSVGNGETPASAFLPSVDPFGAGKVVGGDASARLTYVREPQVGSAGTVKPGNRAPPAPGCSRRRRGRC